MSEFSPQVLAAVAREKEVELTTYGRKTGRPHRKIIWVWGDDHRIFIRSGGGMGRDWPQNLLARGRAVLHLGGGLDVPVVPRHVTDLEEARSLQPLVARKYQTTSRPSSGSEPPTPGETATFELLPAPE